MLHRRQSPALLFFHLEPLAQVAVGALDQQRAAAGQRRHLIRGVFAKGTRFTQLQLCAVDLITRQPVAGQQIKLAAIWRQHQLLGVVLQRPLAELRRPVGAEAAEHQTPIVGHPGQQILPAMRIRQRQQFQRLALWIQRQWLLPERELPLRPAVFRRGEIRARHHQPAVGLRQRKQIALAGGLREQRRFGQQRLLRQRRLVWLLGAGVRR